MAYSDPPRGPQADYIDSIPLRNELDRWRWRATRAERIIQAVEDEINLMALEGHNSIDFLELDAILDEK